MACYAIAATRAAKRSALSERLVGDGLAPLSSALGQHSDPLRSLAFPKNSQWIAYRMNHMQLRSHPEVTRQMAHWLEPRPARANASGS